MNDKNGKSSTERLYFVDFGKGLGMFIIIITHFFFYWGLDYGYATVKGNQNTGVSTLPAFLAVLLFPLILLGTWASVFAYLTGIANAYTIYYHIHEKNYHIGKRLRHSFMNGVIILLINAVYLYLSVYPTHDIAGNRVQGAIPWSIKEGTWNTPSPEIFFIASPLSMIALSDMLVTFVLYVLWRKESSRDNIRRDRSVLFALGLIFIFLAEPIKSLLIPVLYSMYSEGNYPVALLLSWLVGTKQCIFPFGGYAFLGAWVALLHRDRGIAFGKKMRYIGYLSLFFITLSLIVGFVNGFPSVDEWYGLYHPVFLQYLNIGLQLALTVIVNYYFDRIPPESRRSKKYIRKTIMLLRLSSISLTIFLFEEITGAIFAKIVLLVFPALFSNIAGVIALTSLYTFMWIWTVNKWDKFFNFKYSLEWFIVKSIKGKRDIYKKRNTADKTDASADPLNLKGKIYRQLGFSSKSDYYSFKRELKKVN